MKNIAALFVSGLLVTATLSASTLASSAAVDPSQAAIQAAYDEACTALKAGDIDTAMKRLSPGYTVTDPDGKKTDRATLVPSIKAQLAQIKVNACTTQITAFSKDGDNYTATTLQTVDATVLAQGNAPVRAVSSNKDVWKLVDGNWEEASGSIIENTVTMNGSVLVHQGGAAKPPVR